MIRAEPGLITTAEHDIGEEVALTCVVPRRTRSHNYLTLLYMHISQALPPYCSPLAEITTAIHVKEHSLAVLPNKAPLQMSPKEFRSNYTTRDHAESHSDKIRVAATATDKVFRVLLARCLYRIDQGHEVLITSDQGQPCAQPLEKWIPRKTLLDLRNSMTCCPRQ